MQLTSERAAICTSCDPKPCQERGLTGSETGTEICTVIDGLPGEDDECITCTTKTCEEGGVTQEQVCGDAGCESGFECNFNPNAEISDCGGCQACPPVVCSATEELAENGCECISCLPSEEECPRSENVTIGCDCVPNDNG